MGVLKKWLSTGLLIATWLFMFQFITAITDWTFAPWGSIDIIYIPESVSGWELMLNHFFDVGMGQYIFSIPVIIYSIMTWWRSERYHQNKAFILAINNIMLIMGLFVAGSVGYSLNGLIFPPIDIPPERYVETIGYHTTVVHLITWIIVYACWIVLQRQIVKDQRKSKQYTDKYDAKLNASRQRLSDDASDHFLVSIDKQASQLQQLS
ncbi:MAG: hypothetical protein WBC91_08205 [Phototrophicaceae bacterium]